MSNGYVRFIYVVVAVMALLAVSVGATFAQVPTPAAALVDTSAVVANGWQVAIIILALLVIPIGLIYGKSIAAWLFGMMARGAKK